MLHGIKTLKICFGPMFPNHPIFSPLCSFSYIKLTMNLKTFITLHWYSHFHYYWLLVLYVVYTSNFLTVAYL